MKYIKLLEEYEGMLQTSPDIAQMKPEELEQMFTSQLYKDNPDVELIKQIIDQPDFDYFVNSQLIGRKVTPLILATIKGQLEIVKYLLEKKQVAVNMKGHDGQTALTCACRNGFPEIVRYLLSRSDTKVNMQDKGGWAALHWACWKNQSEIVGLLLEHPQIDIKIQDDSGATAWFDANPQIKEQFPQLQVI